MQRLIRNFGSVAAKSKVILDVLMKKEENVAPADNEFRMDPNKLMALTQTPQSMDPTKLLANVDNHEVKEKGVCVCVCVCARSRRET